MALIMMFLNKEKYFGVDLLSVFAAKSVHSGPWRWSGGLACGTKTTSSSPVWASVL